MTDLSSPKSERLFLSGNEAIARGALEAGVGFCTAYPGTPSTEILESLMSVSDEMGIYTEWSVNEKVALEAAAGASWMGIPALCSMKSLGMNVAADFLLNVNLSETGTGGLVIVVCDDPRGHSSSNEQDSRWYAKMARIPLMEPSSCQEAKDIMSLAFDISQGYRVPVIIRSTTRLSHSRGVVTTGEIKKRKFKPHDDIPKGLFNVPNPHLKFDKLDEKFSAIYKELEDGKFRQEREGKADLLIITTGVCGRYAIDAVETLGLDSVEVLQILVSHPLPLHSLMTSLDKKQRVLFVEEGGPFVEEKILSMVAEMEWNTIPDWPVEFFGKNNGVIPFSGEMNTDIVIDAICEVLNLERDTISEEMIKAIQNADSLIIPRPLTFCAGCTHRNVYWAIKRLRKRISESIIVAGDIGCYSLGVFYDSTMNTMQAMGSGIGTACGLGQLHRFGSDAKVIAVAGDSTFFHACIPGLINARHKNAELTFLILDNDTTAMTGFQPHPGLTTQVDQLEQVSIEAIVKAINPDYFESIDGTDTSVLVDSLHRIIKMNGLKVVLVQSVCRLEEVKRGVKYQERPRVEIDQTMCKGTSCKICVTEFGCIALSWDESTDKSIIIDQACIRCGACIAVCPHSAIKEVSE